MSVPPMPAPPSPDDSGWAAAAGQLSLALQPPAWPSFAPDAAAPPLVVIGHDYTGPGPAGDVDKAWTAGLPADDPFLRLLAALAQGTPDAVWLG